MNYPVVYRKRSHLGHWCLQPIPARTTRSTPRHGRQTPLIGIALACPLHPSVVLLSYSPGRYSPRTHPQARSSPRLYPHPLHPLRHHTCQSLHFDTSPHSSHAHLKPLSLRSPTSSTWPHHPRRGLVSAHSIRLVAGMLDVLSFSSCSYLIILHLEFASPQSSCPVLLSPLCPVPPSPFRLPFIFRHLIPFLSSLVVSCAPHSPVCSFAYAYIRSLWTVSHSLQEKTRQFWGTHHAARLRRRYGVLFGICDRARPTHPTVELDKLFFGFDFFGHGVVSTLGNYMDHD